MIGPGESGKTLINRLILGLTKPDSGTITVFGEQPGSVAALQQTGAMLESSDFPLHLKVQEIITLVRQHYQKPADVQMLVEEFGVFSWLEQAAGAMDTARQRWLAFLVSLLGGPRLLVLDSPTIGMDVAWRYRFWEMLGLFKAGGCSALVATDVLHDITVFTTRVLLLHQGRILEDGTCDEIVRRHAAQPRVVDPLADAGIEQSTPGQALQQAVLDRELTTGEGLEEIVLRLTDEVRE